MSKLLPLIVFALLGTQAAFAAKNPELKDIKLSQLQNTLWRAGSVTTGYFWEYRFYKLETNGELKATGVHSLYGEGRGLDYRVELKESSDGYIFIQLYEVYDGQLGESFFLRKKTGDLCNHATKNNVCMKMVEKINEIKF